MKKLRAVKTEIVNRDKDEILRASKYVSFEMGKCDGNEVVLMEY